MKYLLFVAALIATANALTCECSGQQCKEKTCTIKTGNCYSIEREISTEKDKAIIKGCQDETKEPTLCKQGFVLMSSEKDFYLASNITCCNDKDNCNQDIGPDLNMTIPKGSLVCPSCFDPNKKTCDDKQMYCNKLQKKCFSLTGTITKGSAKAQDFIARGCAVDNSIFVTNSTLTFGDTSYKLVNVELKEAKNGASRISSYLSFAILLPSVILFLLDRPL